MVHPAAQRGVVDRIPPHGPGGTAGRPTRDGYGATARDECRQDGVPQPRGARTANPAERDPRLLVVARPGRAQPRASEARRVTDFREDPAAEPPDYGHEPGW